MKVRLIAIAVVVTSGVLLGTAWYFRNRHSPDTSTTPAAPSRHVRAATVGVNSADPESTHGARPLATAVPEATNDVGTGAHGKADAMPKAMRSPSAAADLGVTDGADTVVVPETADRPPDRGDEPAVILTDYRTFTAIARTIDETAANAYEMSGGMGFATPDGVWISGAEGKLVLSPEGEMWGLRVTGEAEIRSQKRRISGHDIQIDRSSNRTTVTGAKLTLDQTGHR